MLEINSQLFRDLYFLLPEIQLAATALILQLLGIFLKKSQRLVGYLSIISMLTILCYINIYNSHFIGHAFNKTFRSTNLELFAKSIILITGSLSLLLYLGLPRTIKYSRKSEYSTLVTLSITGMFIMTSASHFLTLYLGLELQSLSLYILTSFDRDNIKSSEAGLKYFILGALVSGIMLFGISLIYGFSGTLEFEILQNLYNKKHFILFPSPAVTVGVYMILIGIIFKLSIAPFHAWTPDVYEGAPISTVSLLSSSAKVSSFIILINLTMKVFKDALYFYEITIQILAFLSLMIGSLAAIMQTSIKRLFGYSTILNMGYILLALATKRVDAIQASIIFIVIYSFTMLGLLACLTLVIGKNIDNVEINDLAGLSISNKASAMAIAIFLLSLVGIPPFAGFFGKFYIFKSAIQAELYPLVITSILASVISAFYYLRIIKTIYFDNLALDINPAPAMTGVKNLTFKESINFNKANSINLNIEEGDKISLGLIIIASISMFLTMIFIIYPNIILEITTKIIESF